MIIETPRLRLRPWREADGDAFAALNFDPEVARDLGGPLMDRLRLKRDPASDFVALYDSIGTWHGLVWVAPRDR